MCKRASLPFVHAAARTSWLKGEGPGAVSRCTRDILLSVFIQTETDRADIQITVGDIQITVRLHGIVGDEEALSSAWGLKGASGVVPCGLECGSLVNKRRPLDKERGVPHLSDLNPALAHFGSPHASTHGRRTNSSLFAICDLLEAAPAGQRSAMEENNGIKYYPQGLLFCRALRPYLRPMQNNRFDAMHVLFSNGVVNAEIMWQSSFIWLFHGSKLWACEMGGNLTACPCSAPQQWFFFLGPGSRKGVAVTTACPCSAPQEGFYLLMHR